jgi:tetratricopeptide (TPR) repeat protein
MRKSLFRITALALTALVVAPLEAQDVPMEPLSQITPGRPHGQHDPHSKLSAEQQINVALQHQAEGRTELALTTLDQAIGRYPENARLLAVRGSLYLEQGKVSEALKDLEAALSLDPDDVSALVNRAQAYRQFGRIGEALADLDRALELQPDLLPARFNRGAIRYSSGDFEAALADFDYCVALDPHDAAPYFNRAAARDAMGDRAGAVSDLERFLQLTENPQWRDIASDLLARWQETGEPEAGR